MNSEYRDRCIVLQLRGASVYRRWADVRCSLDRFIHWCNVARGVNVKCKVVIKTRKALCAGRTFKTWKAVGKSDVTGQKCF